MNPRRLIVVMGVAGSGKSTVAAAVAERLGVPFVEADDFHPPANRAKMAAGQPLDDADRRPWIEGLTRDLRAAAAPTTILACSALTPAVRGWLEAGFPGEATYVLLSGSRELIAARLAGRRGHFAGEALLDSQFAALTRPDGAAIVDIDRPLDELVAAVMLAIQASSRTGR